MIQFSENVCRAGLTEVDQCGLLVTEPAYEALKQGTWVRFSVRKFIVLCKGPISIELCQYIVCHALDVVVGNKTLASDLCEISPCKQ